MVDRFRADIYRSPTPAAASARRGFSLVELLVVVGIIAALVGILMPALAAVQKQGRKTVCAANLKQIGHSFLLYTQQYHGRFPQSPSLPSVNPFNEKTVQNYLAPFVANGAAAGQDQVDGGLGAFQIFRCPADETLFASEKISYFYNADLGERPVNETFLFRVYHGDLSHVPIMWDGDKFHGGTLPLNWLYCDWHVEPWVQAAKS